MLGWPGTPQLFAVVVSTSKETYISAKMRETNGYTSVDEPGEQDFHSVYIATVTAGCKLKVELPALPSLTGRNEGIYDDEEWVEDECEQCNGTGYEEEYCYNCGGSGEVEDEDEDYVTCSDCGGSGEIEDECGYCGGSGYDEYTQELEKIDLFTLPVFSKTPIIFDDLVDEHKSTINKLGLVKGNVKFIETG